MSRHGTRGGGPRVVGDPAAVHVQEDLTLALGTVPPHVPPTLALAHRALDTVSAYIQISGLVPGTCVVRLVLQIMLMSVSRHEWIVAQVLNGSKFWGRGRTLIRAVFW